MTAGVDRVGLGNIAAGVGEAPHAAGIDYRNPVAGPVKGQGQLLLVAAGRFHAGKGHISAESRAINFLIPAAVLGNRNVSPPGRMATSNPSLATSMPTKYGSFMLKLP